MNFIQKLALFGLGGIAGAILAYIYVKETRIAPLEEEIEDLNDYIFEISSEKDENEEEFINLEEIEDADLHKEYRILSKKPNSKNDNVVVLADVQKYERESSKYSYGNGDILEEITQEEYEKGPDIEAGDEWNNVELSWYAYEQELRDSDDRLVPNTGAFLGDEDFEPPEKWYDASNEVIFLRNAELKCDFKVQLFEIREVNADE